MKTTLWAYAWDVTGEGAQSFVGNVRRAGASGVSLAAAYHSGLFVTPHHRRHRLYFPESGALYFTPSESVLRELSLRPRLSRLLEEADPLRQLTEEAARHDVSVKAWFVGTHNTDMGYRYEEAAVRNAYGDLLYYALCPANEKVQQYIVALLGDLTNNYAVDGVDLECLGFHGFPHDFHHEKDLLGLDAESNFLLTLCFCDACSAQAQAAGVDSARARAVVKEMLEGVFKGDDRRDGAPPGTVRSPEQWIADAELLGYLALRRTVVNGLAANIREEVRSDCKLNLIALSTPDSWWLQGFDEGVLEHFDRVIACNYDHDPAGVGMLIEATSRQAPQTKLSGGVQIGHPVCTSPEDVLARAQTVHDSAADELQVYNYGLLPERNLQWLADAVAALHKQ